MARRVLEEPMGAYILKDVLLVSPFAQTVIETTNVLNKHCYSLRPIPGGVLRFELDRGVPLKLQNPYPSLRVIWAKKGTHF